MVAHRVLYTSGRWETVYEIKRVKARKVPAVLFSIRAPWHRCQHCGEEAHWGPDWIAIARYGDRFAKRGGGDDVYCSAACCGAQNEGWTPQHWMNVNDEPLPIEVRRKVYEIKRRHEDSKRQAVRDTRKCPLPEWKGKGWCKWCNEPMGDKCGRATMWHPACAVEFRLHNVLDDQIAFLVRRDGKKCAMCAREGIGEVDHVIALWKIRHLPAMKRRVYYGPVNLWLLCWWCHKRKTRREAAERAALARQANGEHKDGA